MATKAISAPTAGAAGGGEPPQPAYREAINAFAEVALALSRAIDRDELLHMVARKMCELVGVDRCTLHLVDDETGLFRGQVGHADRDIDSLVKRLTGGFEADGLTKEIVRTRAPVVIRDARKDPRPVKSTIRTWGVRSIMGVPILLGDDVIGYFLLDSENESRDFTDLEQELASAFAKLAAVAISQRELVGELRASNATVARRNQALQRAAAADTRFTRLVISGGSLPEIAAIVAEMTKKPCAILDPQMHSLAAEAAGYPILAGPLAESAEMERAIAGLAADRPSIIGPFAESGLLLRLLAAPVIVRDARWGVLLLAEHGGRFTDFDALIARRAASIVALEMSAERRAALAEWNARAALAAELIRGNRDIADVERRASFLGIRLDQPHVLCLVTGRDGGERLPDAEAIASAVSARSPELSILATGVLEGIAMIVDLPEDEPTPDGLRDGSSSRCARRSGALEAGGELVVGLSSRCVGAADYVRAYDQARQVAACVDAYCPPGEIEVLSADDLGPGRLLLAGSDPAEGRRFAEEAVGPLLGGEAPAELLETLVAFFDSGRSVRRTALGLEVHENTIRYRLGRVAELTGLKVAVDSDAQLQVQIALLVLRLQGEMPVRRRRDSPPRSEPAGPAA